MTPTLAQIDAAERWIWSAFRIEEMPTDHDVHTCLFALRALRLLLDEPTNDICMAIMGANSGDIVMPASSFRAMRSKLLEIVEG